MMVMMKTISMMEAIIVLVIAVVSTVLLRSNTSTLLFIGPGDRPLSKHSVYPTKNVG